MQKLKSPHELQELRLQLQASESTRPCLSVCAGSGCKASGAQNVLDALHREVEQRGLQGSIDIKSTGCHGFCEKGPVMIVWPEKVFYNAVSQSDAKDIVNSVRNGHKPVERLLYKDPSTGQRVVHEHDVPFYARQQRILFGNNGQIDPKDIRDYIKVGGYSALDRVFRDFSPEQVVDAVKRSGLRGRGAPASPLGPNGRCCAQVRCVRATSCAMPTKAIPGRSWTAAYWRATRTA